MSHCHHPQAFIVRRRRRRRRRKSGRKRSKIEEGNVEENVEAKQ
jgi:hypothetical protein